MAHVGAGGSANLPRNLLPPRAGSRRLAGLRIPFQTSGAHHARSPVAVLCATTRSGILSPRAVRLVAATLLQVAVGAKSDF